MQKLPSKFINVTYSSQSLTSSFEMSNSEGTDRNASRTVTEQGDNQSRTKVVGIGEDPGFDTLKDTFKNSNVNEPESTEPV